MSDDLMIKSDNMPVAMPQSFVSLMDDIYSIQANEVVVNLLEPPFPKNGELRNDEVCFYKIKKLSYNEEYPQQEAFENVLMSLDNQSYNFVYILSGDKLGISLYFGVVKNGNSNEEALGNKLSASDYGEIIANCFQGNFNGSEVQRLKGKELTNVLYEETQLYANAGVITGIPSVMELDPGKENKFQGIDRLVNSMLTLNKRQQINWRMVVVCEPVGRKDILQQQRDVYEFYNVLSARSEISIQHGRNRGENKSYAHQESDSRTKTKGSGRSKSHGGSDSSGSSSTNWSRGSSTNESMSIAHTTGDTYTNGTNTGESININTKIINKEMQELMKYIDEELLERLKTGISRGWFKTSIYYMANKPAYANRLKAAIKALVQGNKSTFSPLLSQTINVAEEFDFLKIYQNIYAEKTKNDDNALMLMGRSFTDSSIGLSTYLTPEEICVVAGLPQEEVPGLPMREGVSFALNEDTLPAEGKSINLGSVMQKERILDIPFYLDASNLSKHTFIAGVTGSGKTTTCHRLLGEANMPFLVIEPAKTEYRTLIKQDKDLIVFTLGNEKVAPFRINPFELIPGENISAHVDMIKAAFTSAFPMEASMPQLMEEAIIRCYEKHGWNIELNENILLGDEAFLPENDCFPIMSELIAAINDVVREKKFGERLESEYKGSLISRISNLVVGTKGSMLNCRHSVDFEFIARNNVILELEEMKTPEDKALIIGFILTKLSTTIKAIHKKDSEFRHLTLLEEAHRLLTKVDSNGNGAKKAAVETFADLLAEVRKYGEGLIIVDQIPNKLASEVLKNTNTKIIHRLLAKDDKDAVGDTMMMDDKQKEYLSSLAAGETIIYAENTERPVQVKIEQITNTNEEEISEKIIEERFSQYLVRSDNPLGRSYDEYKYNRLCSLCEFVMPMIMSNITDFSFSGGLPKRMKKEIYALSEKYSLTVNQICFEAFNKYMDTHGHLFPSNEERDIVLNKFISDLILTMDNGIVPEEKISSMNRVLKFLFK